MTLKQVAGGYMESTWEVDRVGWDALMRAPLALVGWSADGEFGFANEAMSALLGLTPEAAAMGVLTLLFPEAEERAAVRISMRELAADSGPPVRSQRQIRRADDGSRRLLDLHSSGFSLGDGRRGVLTTAVDVTDWMPGGGDSGRGFRELIDDAPDVLSRVDARTGQFLFISRAIERISGFSPEEIYQDPELVRRQVQPEFRAAWLEALRSSSLGAPQAMVVGMLHKNGSSFLLHQSLHPVRDLHNNVIVIEGLARDITSVRALETQLEKTIEELRARNAELASLDKLKSQLLANVSHELRTPLVSIKGYNELILSGSLGPLTPRQRRGLEIARTNTERLVELIETLLDFARREEGRLALHRTRIDLRWVIREAVAPMAARIAERGIDLQVDPGHEALEVDGDRARLVQLIRALLSNAEKFCNGEASTIHVTAWREASAPNSGGRTDPIAEDQRQAAVNGPAARIDKSPSESPGGSIFLEVRDGGIGIPAGEREKIFEPFYQVDSSSTRRFGGAGLGLALAREIALLHGGEIGVESAGERGSVFTARLPVAAGVAEPARSGEQPVLLVGAPDPIWRIVRERLEAEGFAPLHADSPDVVVRRARRHRPDAVVLGLPRALTESLIAELKAEPGMEDMPVIALTDVAERALVVGADHAVALDDMAGMVTAIRRLLTDEPPVVEAGARRPRVMVADDDPENLDFTRFLLEREGYDVVSVATGEAALQRAHDGVGAPNPADLVILDVALGGLDGLEVCRRLKSDSATRHVPVLMVTAMNGETIRKRSLDAGADGFLLKPFSVAEFLRQVRLHVRAES